MEFFYINLFNDPHSLGGIVKIKTELNQYIGPVHILATLKISTVNNIFTPWPDSVSDLYLTSNSSLSAKLVPTLDPVAETFQKIW
jgi:hypothetical protein